MINRMSLVLLMAALLILPAWMAAAADDDHKHHDGPKVISMAEAILVAQRTVKGRVLEAEFEMEKEKGKVEVNYCVEILAGKKLHEVEIDARTGKVTETESKTLTEKQLKKMAPSLKEMRKARISLVQAVLAANKMVEGSVLEAELEVEFEDGGVDMDYEIEILQKGVVLCVEVDPISGIVVEVEVEKVLGRKGAKADDDDDDDDDDGGDDGDEDDEKEEEHGGHGHKHEHKK